METHMGSGTPERWHHVQAGYDVPVDSKPPELPAEILTGPHHMPCSQMGTSFHGGGQLQQPVRVHT